MKNATRFVSAGTLVLLLVGVTMLSALADDQVEGDGYPLPVEEVADEDLQIAPPADDSEVLDDVEEAELRPVSTSDDTEEAAADEALPRTGFETMTVLLMGLVLAGAGGTLVVAARRRSHG